MENILLKILFKQKLLPLHIKAQQLLIMNWYKKFERETQEQIYKLMIEYHLYLL